ncbi:DUF4338 domain-containing protein [Desulfosarcina widdelii]|uniref:DUF4338 domain-containing protein n=1 Tax=Desulfosarcina widdelii TaxID=947919 RepID=UPI0018D71ED3|nr:DUF4338 domain-containing protein [Desulfosarcina widdelii]
MKTVECRQFLERLDDVGLIKLPACKTQYTRPCQVRIATTNRTNARPILSVKLSELSPITLHRVTDCRQRKLWSEYLDRYHYLGYRIPFGAQLRYFIEAGADQTRLGCLQFSSPAWRMAARDRWIGWSNEEQRNNLQKIVNNSRFLIFPWVKVKNLASTVLSLGAKIVPVDWLDTFGYRPALMETLVDKKRFPGTCYKAANWVYVGETTGRGRMDRENKRTGMAVKDIYLYPLSKRFRQELMQY